MPQEENVETWAGIDRMAIDYLLLADGAQVVGGKLYLLGGGWDRIQLPAYPQNLHLGVAFGARVPWTETNRKHTFRLRGVTTDGDQELFSAEGEFEVGRPARLPQAMSQLFQVALDLVVNIPQEGQYVVEAVIDEGRSTQAKRYLPFFSVAAGP